MARLFKTCLLWMLALALPVQGFAASVQWACGPAHHQSRMAAHGDGMARLHHVDKADHASITNKAAPASAAQIHTQATLAQDGTDPGHASCSACAACCMGAAAPPSAIRQPVALEGVAVIALLPASFPSGFTPAGLKRPPRHFLI